MSTKKIYPALESAVVAYLRSLPKGRNAKLNELTEHVLREVKTFPKMKRADAYDMIGRLMIKQKRAGTVKYVGGRGCGWRLP